MANKLIEYTISHESAEINEAEQTPKFKLPQLKKLFQKTAKVGFEIEGEMELEDASCHETPRNCSFCEGCSPCDRCYECGQICNYCPDYKSSSYGYCKFNDNRYCNKHDFDICEKCKDEDLQCRGCNPCSSCDLFDENDDKINEEHYAISKILKCRVGHCEYEKNKKSSKFQYIYIDGSVNTELVTSALRLKEAEKVLCLGINTLRRYNTELSPHCGAGGHQTISYRNYFPYLVSRNIIQLVRYYLPALLIIGCVNGSHFRGSFRSLPTRDTAIFGEKYNAVHIKSDCAVRNTPKLIEFRYPDSHTNINQTLFTACINIALCSKAFSLANDGLISIPQNHFNQIKSSVNEFYRRGKFDNTDFVKDLIISLSSDLQDDLKAFIDLKSANNIFQEIHDIIYMENGEDLKTEVQFL